MISFRKDKAKGKNLIVPNKKRRHAIQITYDRPVYIEIYLSDHWYDAISVIIA